MTNGNDKLLKKARNMDRNVEVRSNNNDNNSDKKYPDKTIDPAGLSGGDTTGS